MNKFLKIDWIIYIFLLIIYGYCLLIGLKDPSEFDNSLAQEDGFVEYGTALGLLLVSLVCFFRLFFLHSQKQWTWLLGTAIFGLIFFFGAGEEISWGQRILGVESGDFFTNNNAQGETNLHNLVVDGVKLNKLIFSQLLTVVMVLYLIILPLLYQRWKWLKNLVNRFAVPVVRWDQTVAFILTTLVILALGQADRKWELYEFGFAFLFLLIFLSPQNREIFFKGPILS